MLGRPYAVHTSGPLFNEAAPDQGRKWINRTFYQYDRIVFNEAAPDQGRKLERMPETLQPLHRLQ